MCDLDVSEDFLAFFESNASQIELECRAVEKQNEQELKKTSTSPRSRKLKRESNPNQSNPVNVGTKKRRRTPAPSSSCLLEPTNTETMRTVEQQVMDLETQIYNELTQLKNEQLTVNYEEVKVEITTISSIMGALTLANLVMMLNVIENSIGPALPHRMKAGFLKCL